MAHSNHALPGTRLEDTALKGTGPKASCRLVALGLITLGLLGACTSEGATPKTSPTSRINPSISSSGAATSKVAAQGARGDLTDFVCRKNSDGIWSATGVLVNNKTTAVDYTLLVSVYEVKTSTVVGSVTKAFSVKPHQRSKFTLDKLAKTTASNLKCAAHVTRPE